MKAPSILVTVLLAPALTACSFLDDQNASHGLSHKAIRISTRPPGDVIQLQSIGSEVEVRIDGDLPVLPSGWVRKIWCSFLDAEGKVLASEYIDVLPADNNNTCQINESSNIFKIKLEKGLNGPVVTYNSDPYTARIIELGKSYKVIVHVEYWKQNTLRMQKLAELRLAT